MTASLRACLIYLLLVGVAHAIDCNALTPTILGTDNPETIEGTEGNDIIFAGAGDDTVNGNGGDDVICGGLGNDMLNGGSGEDQLFGQDGDDTLNGGPNSDVLEGGAGLIDTCDGGDADDAADQACEVRTNIEIEIVPVTLFAPDNRQLDGALYIPPGDGGNVRNVGVLVTHGAMGTFDSSVPKIWSLYGSLEGFAVLALNRRDFGSDGGGGKVLFEETTLDLAVGVDFLAALGFEQTFVTGHSQGTQNTVVYPSFSGDDRVGAVGMYGTVEDGRAVARDLLFAVPPGQYDINVQLCYDLIAAGQGDELVEWQTLFGVPLFRSPNNYLSFWGPDTLSVAVREITKLDVPALLMLVQGDSFTYAYESENVRDAGVAAGVDAVFTLLPQPAGYVPGEFGVNAHSFRARERLMMGETTNWLTSRLPAANERVSDLRFPQLQTGGNYSPVADPGRGVEVRARTAGVTLDGSNSVDVDGTVVGYSWLQVGGETVDLDDATAAMPEFDAPSSPQTLAFELTVMDDVGDQGTGTVELTVTAALGDVNADGVIDYVDVIAVLDQRNQPASGPDDPLDIDGSGTITILDARKVALLCDAPACGWFG